MLELDVGVCWHFNLLNIFRFTQMSLILTEKHKVSNQERKQLSNSISVSRQRRLWALWWVEEQTNSYLYPAAELMALNDRRAEGVPDLITELLVLLYKLLSGSRRQQN